MGGKVAKHDKEVEFIQETATSLGLSSDFLESKAELYNEYAAEDKLLNFQEFSELYKELSSDVFEDAYLDDYVKAIFRAFDADQDGQLTFKEWRLGYLLLLLLDREGGGLKVKEEDWTKGMEAVYRLFDADGDGVASKSEVEHITKVLTEPIVAGRLYGGMMERVADEVAKIPEDVLEKGMSQEDFLGYFTITLPKRMNGEVPQPLSEMTDDQGTMDRVTELTKIVQDE